MKSKIALIVISILIIVASLRIVSIETAFVQTFDEPAHIACGMEWLDKGTYLFEPQHPPLTRIMAALGPYLAGSTSMGKSDMWTEGNAILYAGDYKSTLQKARLGNLLFFFIATTGLAWVAWVLYGSAVAVASVFVFTMMPSILGNSGVATTDLGPAAFYAPTILMFVFWLKKPSVVNSALLGLLVAGSVFTKYSNILFLGIGMIVVAVLYLLKEEKPDRDLVKLFKRAFIVFFVFFISAWACFKFSVKPLAFQHDSQWINSLSGRYHVPEGLLAPFVTYPIPLSEFIKGVAEVVSHNNDWGHVAYMLGKTRPGGWWYYYLLVLAVKVPLCILAAYAIGIVYLVLDKVHSKNWVELLPAILPVSLLLGAMVVSNINIGIRHILPVLPFLAITAGYGICRLFNRSLFSRGVSISLVLLLLITSILAHPNYISYFNLIASDAPYRFLIKADLDWGQYVEDLSEYLEENDVPEVSIAYSGTVDLSKHGLPLFHNITQHPPKELKGWLAINALVRFIDPRFTWLNKYKPNAIVKNCFFVYYFDTPVSTAPE